MADLVTMTVDRLQRSPRVGVDVYARTAPGKVEGSGGMFVVVRDAGPQPGRNLSGFSRRMIRVDLYSDCTRDAHGLPLEDDAALRAWATWDGVDHALHDIAHEWSAVCTSLRSDEPSEIEVPGGEHSLLLSGRFEVSA